MNFSLRNLLGSLVPEKNSQGITNPPIGTDNTPFFIVGAPRSGTTLLRNFLRLHPRLECPEETHFFRWADPYDSYRFKVPYRNEKLFFRHRELDGVEDQRFFDAMDSSFDKKALSEWYGSEYLQLRGNAGGRWFDKTPQNVYGVFLIRAHYPNARFIHIVRNPLNVVSSLVEGKVMPVQTLRSAINAWNESQLIMEQFALLAGSNLRTIMYEDLVRSPQETIASCLTFLNEDASLLDSAQIQTHDEQNKFEKLLNAEQITLVKEKTEPFFSKLRY